MKRFLAYLKRGKSVDFPALLDLQSFLANEVIGINYGGCGIAAVVLYDCLVNHGHKPEIVFGYQMTDIDYINNSLCLQNGSNNFSACDHVFIRVGDTALDSKGSDLKTDKWVIQHTMTREQTIAAIKVASWNPTFLRSYYLPMIEERVGYELFSRN